MRTTQRDQTGVITFSGFMPGTGTSGGVAQPGNVPCTFTNTATGNWDVRFDPAITPISATASPIGGPVVRATSIGPGLVHFITEFPSGTSTNATFYFTITGRKLA